MAGVAADAKENGDAVVVAVDAGGSHCRALAARVGTGDTRTVTGGPANPTVRGVAEAVEQMLGAVERAVGALGGRVVALGVGAAGAGQETVRDAVRARLQDRYPGAAVRVVGDGEAALAATPPGPAAVVLAGTGSLVLVRDLEGGVHRAGGWGPAFGDVGSGFWLGQQALQAVAAAADGTGPVTELGVRIAARLGVADLADLRRVCHAPDWTPHRTAALASLVAEAAVAGDAVARRLLAAAGEHLGRLLVAGLARARLPAGHEVFLGRVGGLWRAPAMLAEAFWREAARAPVCLRDVTRDEMVLWGALALAEAAWRDAQSAAGAGWTR